MKRILLSLVSLFVALVMMGQSDSVKKVNVYVSTPKLYVNEGWDSLRFSAMLSTIKKKVNKSQKTQVCDDLSKCEYFLSTILTDYEEKYYSAAQLKSLEGEYVVSFKIGLILSYVPLGNRPEILVLNPENTIAKINFVQKSGRDPNGFKGAIENACKQHPNSSYINQLFENALAVQGLIVELGKDSKGKDVVYVDKGSLDGISTNQWFDVYMEQEDGSLSQVIGTLELVKREEHRSQCKMHKNKEQIMEYINQGKPLVVVSRESSTIIKKGKKLLDDFHAIGTLFTKTMSKLSESLSNDLNEIQRTIR